MALRPTFDSRQPASNDASCNELLNQILDKDFDFEAMQPQHLTIDDNIRKGQVSKFWEKHDGTYIGSLYYKGLKKLYSKISTLFMDINNNFRPIYYIENDEASYPKILRYFELLDTDNITDQEFMTIDSEIKSWITSFKNYPKDIESLINQYSVYTTYIEKLRDFKPKDYPFKLQLDLYTGDENARILERFISSDEDLTSVTLYLKNKKKSLMGTSMFREGKIDERELQQALISERLKFLEAEIASYLSKHPEKKESLKPILKEVLTLNRTLTLSPSLRFSKTLAASVLSSEYQDLFKSAQLDLKKLDEISTKIVESLSPMNQQKLGITDTKKWVEHMKAGRMGIIITGLGSGSVGGGALVLHFWNWYNYDKDNQFNIINAKDEETFRTNLRNYLSAKYSPQLISRLMLGPNHTFTLKNYNPNIKKDVEIVSIINQIVIYRNQYKSSDKAVQDLEENISKALDALQLSTGGPVTTDKIIDASSLLPSLPDTPALTDPGATH